MRPLAYFRSLTTRFLHRVKIDRELEEEVRSHIELRAQDLERLGLDRREAERRARIEFGGAERIKEECREAIAGNFVDVLIQDLRFSMRMLRKAPGFSGIVIATMALGVGATTAIFTVIDATLLHPLPYPHSEQLVRLEDNLPGMGARDVGMSEPEWQDLQHSGIFEYVSPAWYDDNNLTGSSRPAQVSLLIVAPDYFALLGVKPQLGRTFNPEDHSPSFTTEVVISNGLWKRTFGGDPNIIRKSIRLDTDIYHIVGVMPAGFRDPSSTAREKNIEVWAATSFYGPPMADHPPRSGRNLPTAIARLKTGLTIAGAQSRLDALVTALQKEFPQDYPQQMKWTVRIVPLKDSVIGNVRQSLLLLFAAVGLVLLIACVNVANLLLARASARGRELAIRQALGAARPRLARQLLTESLLLSVVGGIAGLAVLFCSKEFLVRLIPESLPRLNDITISWGVLAFALIASVVCGVIFGLAPAIQAGRLDLNHMLKQEGRGSAGSGERARTRRLLVVTEFGLSLVLMIAAGLLLQSFWQLVNVELGFNPESVMTVKTRLPYPNDINVDRYKTAAEQAPLFRKILRRCGRRSGVQETAMGDLAALPLGHDRSNQTPPVPMIVEGQSIQSNEAPLVDESIVTPEYFHLMGMTLGCGRLFNDLDNDKTEAAAVINEAMAKTFWPNENPIGRHIKLSRKAASWTRIVGIVANARTESLEDSGVPQVYSSLYQRGAKHLVIFLRGGLNAAAIPDQVRESVQSIDATLPVFAAQTLNDTVSSALSQRRFSMEVVALFALTALLLAALGIYGVMSYMVTERTHEIGIRLALGAHSTNVVNLVVGQGLRLALLAAAVGLAGAIVVSHLMAGLLYGVRPTDPVIFGAVAFLLIIVALLASYLPARRALRIDPIIALRYQ